MAILPSLRTSRTSNHRTDMGESRTNLPDQKRSWRKTTKSNKSNGSNSTASPKRRRFFIKRATDPKKIEKDSSLPVVTIGGGYRSGLTRSDPSSRLVIQHTHNDDDETPRSSSSSSSHPIYSTSSISSSTRYPSSLSSNGEWNSCGVRNYHRHSPLIVKSASVVDEDGDLATELGMVMARSRKLPGMWYYSSNHIMINKDRAHRQVAPLTRLRELDELARQHAAAMAQQDKVFHSATSTSSVSSRFRRMGENVASGPSIKDIHREMMMKSLGDKNNILDRRYTHMGVGTAKSPIDGRLYLCQVFRG